VRESERAKELMGANHSPFTFLEGRKVF